MAFAVLLGASTAGAQVTSIEDLEGIYNMTWKGASNPVGYDASPSGSATVELHATEDGAIELVGFYHPDVTAHATVEIAQKTISLPYQKVSETLLKVHYQFNAIGAGEFSYDYEQYIANGQPLTGTISDDKTISFSNVMVTCQDGYDYYSTDGYKNVKLTFESELPSTAVKGIVAGQAVVGERWFTIDGREAGRPAAGDGRLYIVVRQLSDGTTQSLKVLN